MTIKASYEMIQVYADYIPLVSIQNEKRGIWKIVADYKRNKIAEKMRERMRQLNAMRHENVIAEENFLMEVSDIKVRCKLFKIQSSSVINFNGGSK